MPIWQAAGEKKQSDSCERRKTTRCVRVRVCRKDEANKNQYAVHSTETRFRSPSNQTIWSFGATRKKREETEAGWGDHSQMHNSFISFWWMRHFRSIILANSSDTIVRIYIYIMILYIFLLMIFPDVIQYVFPDQLLIKIPEYRFIVCSAKK